MSLRSSHASSRASSVASNGRLSSELEAANSDNHQLGLALQARVGENAQLARAVEGLRMQLAERETVLSSYHVANTELATHNAQLRLISSPPSADACVQTSPVVVSLDAVTQTAASPAYFEMSTPSLPAPSDSAVDHAARRRLDHLETLLSEVLVDPAPSRGQGSSTPPNPAAPRTPMTRRDLQALSASRAGRMREFGLSTAGSSASDIPIVRPTPVPAPAPSAPAPDPLPADRLLSALEQIARVAAAGSHERAPSDATGASVLGDEAIVNKLRTADVKGLPDLVFRSSNSVAMLQQARQWIVDLTSAVNGIFHWRDVGSSFLVKAESLALDGHRTWQELAPGRARGAGRPDPALFLQSPLEVSLNAILISHILKLLPVTLRRIVTQRTSARLGQTGDDSLPLGAEALADGAYLRRLRTETPWQTPYGIFSAVLQYAYNDGPAHREHVRAAILEPSAPAHANDVYASLLDYEEVLVTAEWLGDTLPISPKDMADHIRRFLRPAEAASTDLLSDRQDYDRNNKGRALDSLDAVKGYLLDLRSLVHGYEFDPPAVAQALEARRSTSPGRCPHFHQPNGCARGRLCPNIHDFHGPTGRISQEKDACPTCGCSPSATCADSPGRHKPCPRPLVPPGPDRGNRKPDRQPDRQPDRRRRANAKVAHPHQDAPAVSVDSLCGQLLAATSQNADSRQLTDQQLATTNTAGRAQRCFSSFHPDASLFHSAPSQLAFLTASSLGVPSLRSLSPSSAALYALCSASPRSPPIFPCLLRTLASLIRLATPVRSHPATVAHLTPDAIVHTSRQRMLPLVLLSIPIQCAPLMVKRLLPFTPMVRPRSLALTRSLFLSALPSLMAVGLPSGHLQTILSSSARLMTAMKPSAFPWWPTSHA